MFDELRQFEVACRRHPLAHDVAFRDMLEGSTVTEVVAAMDISAEIERYGLPIVTLIRGGDMAIVPLDMWRKVRPKTGTRVDVGFLVPEGGAVISLLASIALPQAATAIAGSLYAAGTLGYALTVAAVTIVGTLAVQALIPPAKVDGVSGAENYAITGTSNAANRHGVFPYVLGRHRMFPPLTATGYSEISGQDVYYYGRMTFGYGPVTLEDLRIGTTPITEFDPDEIEIELRNVDHASTLSNIPELADYIVDRSSEDLKPKRKLEAVGDQYTFSPKSAAAQVTLKMNVSATFKKTGFTFVVEEAVQGSGSWSQVASYDVQAPAQTGNLPRAVSDETRTFTSSRYADGVSREYRVTLTGATDRADEETGGLSWLILLGRKSDAVTVTEASAEYQERQLGWRYGSESMFLYPEDITQDEYNAMPEQGAPVVRYTRPASTAASVDLSFSRGLYDGTDDGLDPHHATFEFYYQSVEGGVDDASWIYAGARTYEGKSTSVLRYSYALSFPKAGEYAIKVERINEVDPSDRDENRAWVTAIRSLTGETLPSPEQVAEISFRARASDRLNGRVDALNAIVQQLAPVWDGSAWTGLQPVRHPAWIYLQAIRGDHLRRPVTDFRIDLAAFKAWADEEPHWTCDYVIDTPRQTGEVLDIICAAGRAKRTLVDFRWSVIRDGAAGRVRQTFTPRNSWNYSAKLTFPRDIHGFRCKARSERLEWEEDEILVLMDGYTRETATELETLQLPGVVVTADDEDEGNVYRLGRYHLAAALNRPETHTFYADWEHIRVQRGDKIRFVHDVSLIGHGSARISAITEDGSGNVTSITLDDVFDLPQDTFRLSVRNPADEAIFAALAPADPESRIWTPSVTIAASDIAVGDLLAIEEETQPSAEMLVTGIYPEDDDSARLTCVDAVPEILGADTGAIPTYSPIVTNPRDRATSDQPPAPVIVSAYSDDTSRLVLPDLSVRPRIAVQLAPFASRVATEGMVLQLRWREAGSAGPYSYGEQLDAGEYLLLTGALTEGALYEGQVRATGPGGKSRGWINWPTTVTATASPAALPEISATAAAENLLDAEGNPRRPGIRLNWNVPSNTALRVTWQLRLAVTGVVVQRGLFADASEASVLITDGILPATAYQIRPSFVGAAADQRRFHDWIDVTTDDVRLSIADIVEADLQDSVDAAEASAAAALASAQEADLQRGLAEGAKDAAEDAVEDALGYATAAAASEDAVTAYSALISRMAGQGESVLASQYLEPLVSPIYTGAAPTAGPNEIYPIGQSLAFTSSAGTDLWLEIAGADWVGALGLAHYRVEAEFDLRAGALLASGILIRWTYEDGAGGTIERVTAHQMSTIADQISDTGYSVSKIVERPQLDGSEGALIDMAIRFSLNDNTYPGGRYTTDITLHRLNVRTVTQEELGLGEVYARGQELYYTLADESGAFAGKLEDFETALIDPDDGAIGQVRAYVGEQNLAGSTLDEAIALARNELRASYDTLSFVRRLDVNDASPPAEWSYAGNLAAETFDAGASSPLTDRTALRLTASGSTVDVVYGFPEGFRPIEGRRIYMTAQVKSSRVNAATLMFSRRQESANVEGYFDAQFGTGDDITSANVWTEVSSYIDFPADGAVPYQLALRVEGLQAGDVVEVGDLKFYDDTILRSVNATLTQDYITQASSTSALNSAINRQRANVDVFGFSRRVRLQEDEDAQILFFDSASAWQDYTSAAGSVLSYRDAKIVTLDGTAVSDRRWLRYYVGSPGLRNAQLRADLQANIQTSGTTSAMMRLAAERAISYSEPQTAYDTVYGDWVALSEFVNQYEQISLYLETPDQPRPVTHLRVEIRGASGHEVVIGDLRFTNDALDQKIGSLSGYIDEISTLNLDALAGTAFAGLMTELGVTVNTQNGTVESNVSVLADAIADIEGNASAGYLIRAQAGSQVSLLDLVAADGDGSSVSVAKLAADDIILDGTVGGEKFVIGLLRNEIEDAMFSTGSMHWNRSGTGASSGETTLDVRQPGQTYASRRNPSLALVQSGTETGGNTIMLYRPVDADGNELFGENCEAGQWWEVSCYAAGVNASGNIAIRFYDDSGTLLQNTNGDTINSGSGNGEARYPEGWDRVWAKAQAPSGARYVTMRVLKNGTIAPASNSLLAIYKPQITESSQGAARPTTFSPSTTTVIDGGMISTDTVVIRDKAQMAEAVVGSAQIEQYLQSTNYSPGNTGWRINKNGDAEFNGVVLSRDMIVDSGTITDTSFGTGESFRIETNTPFTAWGGPDTTYIAVAATRNWEIQADTGPANNNNVYWGVVVKDIVAWTRWSGPQRIHIDMEIDTRNVNSISPNNGSNVYIDWTLYKVT